MVMTAECTLCPRRCRVNRENGEKGYCGESAEIVAARAALHLWEEPCISGKKGSGTVFFSGCALHCVFCQNESIANGDTGKKISVERLTEIFFELKEKGANNINLVTPGHFAPGIAKALEKAKAEGFDLPVVYNTGSYESMEALRRFDGLVDIYLPDLKYMDIRLSLKYSHALDYFETASKAIAEMVRQTKEPLFVRKRDGKLMGAEDYNRFCDDGDEILMVRGTVIRHLLLPGQIKDSMDILEYLHRTYGNKVFISIMNQFTPLKNLEKYPELNRKVTAEEYEAVIDFAIESGIENAFIQEGDTAEESFIPDFSCEGI